MLLRIAGASRVPGRCLILHVDRLGVAQNVGRSFSRVLFAGEAAFGDSARGVSHRHFCIVGVIFGRSREKGVAVKAGRGAGRMGLDDDFCGLDSGFRRNDDSGAGSRNDVGGS